MLDATLVPAEVFYEQKVENVATAEIVSEYPLHVHQKSIMEKEGLTRRWN